MSSDSHLAAPGGPSTRPHAGRRVLGGALLLALALLLAAAIALWARHGGAVFFDLMAAGIAYCL